MNKKYLKLYSYLGFGILALFSAEGARADGAVAVDPAAADIANKMENSSCSDVPGMQATLQNIQADLSNISISAANSMAGVVSASGVTNSSVTTQQQAGGSSGAVMSVFSQGEANSSSFYSDIASNASKGLSVQATPCKTPSSTILATACQSCGTALQQVKSAATSAAASKTANAGFGVMDGIKDLTAVGNLASLVCKFANCTGGGDNGDSATPPPMADSDSGITAPSGPTGMDVANVGNGTSGASAGSGGASSASTSPPAADPSADSTYAALPTDAGTQNGTSSDGGGGAAGAGSSPGSSGASSAGGGAVAGSGGAKGADVVATAHDVGDGSGDGGGGSSMLGMKGSSSDLDLGLGKDSGPTIGDIKGGDAAEGGGDRSLASVATSGQPAPELSQNLSLFEAVGKKVKEMKRRGLL